MWARAVVAVLACVLMLLSNRAAWAQQRPPGYAEAEATFRRLPPEERVYAQTLMIAAGYWNAVPNVDFSGRTFEAVKRLQAEMGREPTGQLGIAELSQLERNAAPLIRKWGFRQVRHPDRAISIWIPFGLNLALSKDQYGVSYKSDKNNIAVFFKIYPTLDLTQTYYSILNSMKEKGNIIHFSVLRSDFYVISSSTISGIDRYERFQRDGAGIIGFEQIWRSEAIDLRAERIATLISASLWTQYNRTPLSPPERLLSQRYQPVAENPPPKLASAPTPPPNPTEAPKREGGSGTGFVVSTDGHLVTNAHVIDKCSSIEISSPDQPALTARIVARDDTNDVALLISPGWKPKDVVRSRTGAKLGEQVVAFGYPLTGVLAVSGNFTIGNVTSLAGLGNDSRYLQISTPVQPGNSGGPLFDQYGNVVGIVTAKLNALRTALATGDIPQNVNFALKIGSATNLMETSGVTMAAGSTEQAFNTVELAERARRLSVQVHCRP